MASLTDKSMAKIFKALGIDGQVKVAGKITAPEAIAEWLK